MYQISDSDGPLFTVDDMREAFRTAQAGSVHAAVYVANLDTGAEVMLLQGRVVYSTQHNHGQPNGVGPVCTILNCGE